MTTMHTSQMPARTKVHFIHICRTSPICILACCVASYTYAQLSPATPALLNGSATTDSGADKSSQVATDGQGHWVAVWQSEEDLGGVAGTDADIFVARSANNGASWTAPATLNSNASTDSGDDFDPAIATDNMGNWVVAWRSDENLGGVAGTEDDLFVARSSDDGATWTPPAFLNSDAATDSENDGSPDLTTDGLGHWVAVWRSNVGQGPGETDADIFVARSADNGANWSAPTTLNTDAEGNDGADLFPQVATDKLGHWIAVWVALKDIDGAKMPDPDLLVASSGDNGVTWSDPTLLNTNAEADSGTDSFPQLTADGTGKWVVVWQSDEDLLGAGSTDQDIFVVRSTNDGVSWTAPALLNSNATSDSGHDGAPQITTDGFGNWIAVWWSEEDLVGEAGTDTDILVAYSTDNGATWTDPALLNSNGTSDEGSDLAPQVTTNGLGNWIAVWESSEDLEDAGTDQDIFTTRFVHPHVTVDRPNGDQHIRHGRRAKIEWTATGDSGDEVRIHLLRNDRKFQVIKKSTPNDGAFRWKVKPSRFPVGDEYKVRVTPLDFPTAKDSSDFTFSIISP